MSTIFQKIIDRKIKADIIYEDDLCLAFKDINPQAPIHLLLIPKEPIPSIDDCKKEHVSLLGHLMTCIPGIADKAGIAEEGYRVVTNCRDFGKQTVYHLHFHILGGRQMDWPPG